MQRKSKPVEPLARFAEEGDLVWNTDLVEKIRQLGKLSKGGGAGGQKNDLTITWGNANWRSL